MAPVLDVAVTGDDVPVTVLDNHSVVRDGSYWTCRFCGEQWPYPTPLPETAGTCVPRKWGEVR